MLTTVPTLLGGIGLFLFGMETMTSALAALANRRARAVLARVARRPVTAALTGAAITALIQSSSATLVMTIGFVGAGLLRFRQAVGVIMGANLGTTLTGWIVLLVGFKLELGLAALPLLFLASLLMLFGRPALETAGRVLAGFALIFIGIGVLQEGMGGLQGVLTPDRLPSDTLTGRLLMVGLGIAIAGLTQSSSAGMAAALALLGAGAIGQTQAAALVIGLNLGTTVTGLLAVLGGSVPMRQTAVANVLFNAVTALLAFAVLPPVMAALARWDDQTALVLFHTGFNIAGLVLLLPVIGPFTALVQRLVPDPPDPVGLSRLDPRLLRDTGAALDTAGGVLDAATATLFAGFRDEMGGASGALDSARQGVGPAVEALRDYLSRIPPAAEGGTLSQRQLALVNQLDHLGRLAGRGAQGARLRSVLREGALRRPVAILAGTLGQALDGTGEPSRLIRRLERLERRLAVQEVRIRHISAHRPPHVLGLTPAHLLRLTGALRWTTRVAGHVRAILEAQQEAVEHPRPVAPLAAGGAPPA